MGEASPILPCSRAHEEPPLTAHSHDSQMDWEFPYFVFCVLVACIAFSKHSEGNGTPLQYSCLENPMDRGAWWAACSPWGHEELDTNERLHFHFSLSCIGEGNGNPLQCSCLENPRDGGAWWAAVYGVAQSWTRLK